MSLLENTTLFVELLLPVPIAKLFTYRIPQSLNESAQVGQRAIVQFGERKILTGLVVNIHTQPPKEYEAKYILEFLDDEPVVNTIQLKFFEWIASYYCCTQGEVLNAALPAGLKLSSESKVQLHPSFSWDNTSFQFSEKEELILNRLTRESLSYTSICKILGVKNVHSLLKSLTKKEAIILLEEVQDKYKPKTERRLRLKASYLSSENLELLFEQLKTKPKQEEVLLKFLQLVPVMADPSANQRGVAKSVFLNNNISESSINTLIKNNVLEEFNQIVPRFSIEEIEVSPVSLSKEQIDTENKILNQFETTNTVLLHGVTGSGKTEIYIQLIHRALLGGSQVLLLLPEIALTTQIVQRLKHIFGNSMGVYHSRFSDNERVEVWKNIISGQFKFIVGVRSSIFLPFENLGLIIVDEEHDPSYKQQEPSPRYHARDSAIMLSQLHHAKVLLGSATPSIESFYQTQQKKYGIVSLSKRYGEALLPVLSIANLRIDQIQKKNKGEFSSLLLNKIENTLNKNEQVIIFQNRRGYSPTISCEDCLWIPKCVNCSVSLTYHHYRNALICHYCGYKESMPNQCPSCTSNRIKTVGYGTEKLEEELKLYFPNVTIQRMDLDTTRSKSSYENIISQFEKGETKILVGTQMITKGLDFDNVSLVGVFNADRVFHFPDFRSYERAFQLITQVSGRAGRRKKQGEVIIQTSQPEHPVLNFILQHDYMGFYEAELNERYKHFYPPYTRLIKIIIKHIDKKICYTASMVLVEKIKNLINGIQVLGPSEPPIAKIRNQFLMSTLIKIGRGSQSLQEIKLLLLKEIEKILHEKEYRAMKIVVDVDPF